MVQPDGHTFQAYLLVETPVAYLETVDGYTILRDPVNKVYRYATRGDKGDLYLGSIPVRARGYRSATEHALLQSLPNSLRYTGDRLAEIKADQAAKNLTTNTPQEVFPATGVRRALLLLIDYPDQLHQHTVGEFDNFTNQSGYSANGATGSFRDYYLDISHGRLTIDTDVEGWYTSINNRAYYGVQDLANRQYGPARELVREAVDAAEAAGVNFANYDGDGDGYVDIVEIIHSGRGTEESGNPDDIWSHKSGLGGNSVTYDGVTINEYIMQAEKYGSNIANIGVLVHEFGHALGLPDLYDTDGSSSGIGRWCVMAGGTWNNGGRTPAHMSAWCKDQLGWTVTTVLDNSGTISNMSFADNSDQIYRINTPSSNEYYLIENRQQQGWDDYIPGSGLAIWHIDSDQFSNQNDDNRLVDLEQADGDRDLNLNNNSGDNGDLYPGSSGNSTFDCASLPSSDLYNNAPSNVSIDNITQTGNLISFSYGFCNTNCNIAAIQTAGVYSNFNGFTYDQTITISYAFAPNLGTLDVTLAGVTQNLPITGSPQTVTFTGLPGDGSSVAASAQFSMETSCNFSVSNLYTAPQSCQNDNICDALDITSYITSNADVSCTNEGATSQLNEPRPYGSGGACNVQNGWCENSVTHSVWFSFTAPASGSIDIDFTSPIDMQMALWEADNCQDLLVTPLRYLVAANDDGGSAGGWSPRIRNATGLVPGKTYFLQVDGWTGTTGSFTFAITDPGLTANVAPSGTDGCGNVYSAASTGRGEWVHIRDNNDVIIASVNDGFANLGNIDLAYNLFTGSGMRLDGNNFPLLKRDWQITPTNNLAATVRLYLTDQELQDFLSNSGLASLADMLLLKVSGGNCGQPSGGSPAVLVLNSCKENFAPNRHMLEYKVSGFSGFFPRSSSAILPIDLLTFTGVATDKSNALHWVSSTEQNTDYHEIQRLAPNSNEWKTIGELSAAGWSQEELSYDWEDAHPLPTAYYRIKTVDFDETFSTSPVIEIKRSGGDLTVGRVYPNPVQTQLDVELHVEEDLTTNWELLAANGQQLQNG
ncbi:MAG: M6 family metalloprotease domain-containing protein, partial [Bacteroidota bacterium]